MDPVFPANRVLLHQTIIGEEALRQFAKVDDYPDVIVGCTGGGSNFAGLSFPFIRENLKNGKNTKIRGVEPASFPSLTHGEYRYDFGDTAGMTPLMKMHTLGHDFVPEPTHALAEIIRQAKECKKTGEEKVLLTALCGRGHFDRAKDLEGK